MKFAAALGLLTTVFVVSACSDAPSKKGSQTPQGGAPVNASAHVAAECPAINGSFYLGKEAVGARMKRFTTNRLENGISLSDTEETLIVDAQLHKMDPPEKDYSYMGICEKSAIKIEYYEGKAIVARENLTLTAEGALLIETSSVDGRVPDSSETWVRGNDLRGTKASVMGGIGMGLCYSSMSCTGTKPTGGMLVDEDTCRVNDGHSLEVAGTCWPL